MCHFSYIIWCLLKNFNKRNKKSLYDNTEYIYKANLVRNLLEKSIPESLYNSSTYYVYCRNSLSDDARCYNHSTINNFENDLFSMLGVEAVYITLWDVTAISAESITTFEATTQNYIKTMDPTSENAFRIIVMFRSENNDTNKEVYEYATLRFGSRG